jgi:hypothetical protein
VREGICTLTARLRPSGGRSLTGLPGSLRRKCSAMRTAPEARFPGPSPRSGHVRKSSRRTRRARHAQQGRVPIGGSWARAVGPSATSPARRPGLAAAPSDGRGGSPCLPRRCPRGRPRASPSHPPADGKTQRFPDAPAKDRAAPETSPGTRDCDRSLLALRRRNPAEPMTSTANRSKASTRATTAGRKVVNIPRARAV